MIGPRWLSQTDALFVPESPGEISPQEVEWKFRSWEIIPKIKLGKLGNKETENSHASTSGTARIRWLWRWSPGFVCVGWDSGSCVG